MRVIHVLWTARFGGIERVVLDLMREQRRMGLDVGVLFGHEGGAGEMYVRYAQSGAECHLLGLRSGRDLSPRKFYRAREIFREYDVVHVHMFNPLLMFAACRSGRAVVYTEHGNFGFGRSRRASDLVLEVMKRAAVRRCADYLTFNSRFTERMARERYASGIGRSRVVYNGIAIDEVGVSVGSVPPEAIEAARGRFVVGTCARLAGVKRVDKLVRAFAAMAGESDDVLLLLVGDGPLRGELTVLASELGIGGKVLFTGYVENAPAYVSLMDVFVMPSVGESFGLAVVEAMALGKAPVLFSDGGGCVEIAGGIDPRNVVGGERELAARLSYLEAHREELAATSGAARQAAARFHISAMADALDEVYGEALGRR